MLKCSQLGYLQFKSYLYRISVNQIFKFEAALLGDTNARGPWI